jgi:taurine dioxygenase
MHTITPLGPYDTGAEIRGIDLSGPLPNALREELNDAFARHHVLVFRDQRFGPREFARAAENFGEIMPQHVKGHGSPEHPDVFEMKPVRLAPGQFMVTGEAFHTDHSWDPRPPKATALYPVKLPGEGGDTQFCNVHQAYDDLPDETKQRIEDLRAVHVYYSRNARRKVRTLDEESLRDLPAPSIHPLAPRHPENGRRYLYVNPVRMESIVGMADSAALELIESLMAHATQLKYEYRHRWRMGDMVIWDNRSVLHKANGDYDMQDGEGRHMYRLMLKGPAPLV